jgi:hypothetical protein
MAWTKQTGTKHSADCKMVFGRKDSNCPRCQELIAGSKPRTWAVSNDTKRCAGIRDHFRSHKHLSGGCGVICTFGEW